MPKTQTKTFYRYDSWASEYNAIVRLRKFNSIKETPCGWWIKEDFGINWESDKSRWISNSSRKRYAYPTKKEALTSFKMRKKRQINILTMQLDSAKHALSKVERHFDLLLEKK